MADNTPQNGTADIAADDISSVLYPRGKITLGADGVNDGDVSASNPMPVKGTGTAGTANSGVVTVQGIASMTAVQVADNGGSLTVDGSVTANAGTNLNTSLLALESGGNLASCATSLGTLDNAIAGSEMQVDVVGALPAGTNAIGKLAANSGVDIGDVDVTSLPALAAGDNAIGRVKLTDGTDVADILDLTNSNPLTVAIVDGSGSQITSFGGGTQYTEGDTNASITGTAMLWEDASNTLVVPSASKPFPVEIKAGAGSGGTAAADDADFTAGTTSGTPVMGVYESSPTSVTNGDMGIAGLTQTRELRVSDSVAISSLGNITTYVADIPSIAGCVAGTELQVDVVGALPAGTNNIGDVDVLTVPSDPFGANADAASATGSISAKLRFIASTGIPITGTVTVGTHAVTQSGTWTVTGTGGTFPVTDSGGSLTVDNGGTFAVQVDGSALTSLQLLDDVVFADDAAFTAGTSKVGVLGGTARRARRTAVSADGDAVALACDRYGRVQTAGVDLSATAVQVTASGDTALVAAPGAGNRLKIIRVEASNSHATVAVTAGLKTAAINSGNTFGKKYLPALGGQATWQFPLGHLLCGDNEAFNANLSAGSTTIEYTVYFETIAN